MAGSWIVLLDASRVDFPPNAVKSKEFCHVKTKRLEIPFKAARHVQSFRLRTARHVARMASTRDSALDAASTPAAAASAGIARFNDPRYRGQSSDLTVPIPEGPLSEQAMRSIEERFESEFERTYGHRADAKAFELVTVRLVLRLPRAVEHGKAWMPDGSAAEETERPVYFGPEQGRLGAAVLSRRALALKACRGPALIQEYDTTIVVPPGCEARLDDHDNVAIAVAS